MNLEQQLQYLDNNYTILSSEKEFIVHPAALALMPLTADSLVCSFSCSYEIINYCLSLKSLTILNERISGLSMDPAGNTGEQHFFQDKHISYNGAILIGNDLIREYVAKGYGSCIFSYKNVIELIFEDGNVITTIDHSKDMLRIRKNIELGLRSLTNKRDVRCITHFMNSTFLGDYSPFPSVKKRQKYIEGMKAAYQK